MFKISPSKNISKDDPDKAIQLGFMVSTPRPISAVINQKENMKPCLGHPISFSKQIQMKPNQFQIDHLWV